MTRTDTEFLSFLKNNFLFVKKWTNKKLFLEKRCLKVKNKFTLKYFFFFTVDKHIFIEASSCVHHRLLVSLLIL